MVINLNNITHYKHKSLPSPFPFHSSPTEHQRHHDTLAVHPSPVIQNPSPVLHDFNATAPEVSSCHHSASGYCICRPARTPFRSLRGAELTTQLLQHCLLGFAQCRGARRGILGQATVSFFLLDVALHGGDALVSRWGLVLGGGIVDVRRGADAGLGTRLPLLCPCRRVCSCIVTHEPVVFAHLETSRRGRWRGTMKISNNAHTDRKTRVERWGEEEVARSGDAMSGIYLIDPAKVCFSYGLIFLDLHLFPRFDL